MKKRKSMHLFIKQINYIIYRETFNVTSEQNIKMRDQISLLIEKLEFFIERVQKEQGLIKRGEYFTLKDEQFKGKDNFLIIIYRER